MHPSKNIVNYTHRCCVVLTDGSLMQHGCVAFPCMQHDVSAAFYITIVLHLAAICFWIPVKFIYTCISRIHMPFYNLTISKRVEICFIVLLPRYVWKVTVLVTQTISFNSKKQKSRYLLESNHFLVQCPFKSLSVTIRQKNKFCV